MNKRRLVSAGLIGAVLSWSAPPAHAVDLTLDLTQAAHAVVQIQQTVQALNWMMCQYQQLQATTSAVLHANPNVGNIAPALQSSQMQLPGAAASAMPGMTSGTSGVTSAGQQFFNQNSIYQPTGTDFAATEMARQLTATSNIQGQAQTGMAQIASRIASLTALATSIQTQPDVTSVAAVNSQINAEHLYIANESNNLSNLQLMANMQQQASQLRSQQNARMQQEQFGNAAAAQAGFGTTQ
jgi:type IV secretion system protein VirB5